MVVHPPDEGAEVPKEPLDLGGLPELPLSVEVRFVAHGPPLVDRAVDG